MPFVPRGDEGWASAPPGVSLPEASFAVSPKAAHHLSVLLGPWERGSNWASGIAGSKAHH